MNNSKHDHKRIKMGQTPGDISIQHKASLLEKGKTIIVYAKDSIHKVVVGSSWGKRLFGKKRRAVMKERLQQELKDL